MRDDELQNLVDEFLYLVEVGSDSQAADESELAHLLDRLALGVRHGVDPGEPETRPEIPPRDVELLQKVAASRFPSFGSYNRASALLESATRAHVEQGNAAEDVASVADHLHVVAWLWRSHGADAALWYLHESYREHWGSPMRHLQLYLYLREHARDHERE